VILVTVGTYDRGFERLVHAADEMAGLTDEPVVIQCGIAECTLRHFSRSFRFSDSREMEELTSQARVIIMHGGAGSLIMALKLGKPLVVVPRLRKYREAMNDHQIQLAAALAQQNRVILVMEPGGQSLLEAVRQAADLAQGPLDNTPLILALRKQLSLWNAAQVNP
jgi:UDP-N-acetylglucosamine transferase subunit ALG13